MSSESISIGAGLATSAAYASAADKPSSSAAAKSNQPSEPLVNPAATPAVAQNGAPESKTAAAQEMAQQEQQDPGPLDPDELRALIDEVNSTLYSMNRALRFEVHDKTEDLVVHVVNTKTDEVIRQYPSEEVLQRRERLLAGEVSAFKTRVD